MTTEGRLIQSISFRPDGVVEVQYVESYDQGEHVAIVRVLAFDASILNEAVEELMSDVDDLVSVALDALRG